MFGRGRARPLHVAVLAPPWIPVPPPGYGGIEFVISEIASALVCQGHDVALLAAPGSRSAARVVPLLESPHPEAIGDTLFDVDHAARALEVINRAADRGYGFDIVHDHSGFALVAMADHVEVPVLHTLHGPFTSDTAAFYRRHSDKVWISALTRAQLAMAPPEMRCVGTVPNPIDARAWPLVTDKDDYLLWVGRMDPTKGPHRAIAAARQAGVALVLAGPVQPGQQEFFEAEVAPHLDGDRIRYVDEVGGQAKRQLFAHARALLMPIRWPEPFGMVMVEAMICGTPVIAFREGSVPEVVADGVCGYVVEDEAEMADAVGRLGEIDPVGCRSSAEQRFDTAVVSRAYEDVYRRVIAESASTGVPAV
jgi:hypothetical protein